MKKLYKIFKNFIFVFLFTISIQASAQVTKTSYFMKSPYSHKLNPALQPHRGYVGFPGLGNMYLHGNTGVAVADILYPTQNGLGTFLHPEVKKNIDVTDIFHKKITPFFEIDYNILSFGFHQKEAFISFDMSLKANSTLYIPRGIIEFIDKGSSVKPYDFGFGFDLNAYVETALGYSRKLSDQLTVGAKIKYLAGAANAKVRMEGSELIVNEDIVKATLTGTMMISTPSILHKEIEELVGDMLKEGTSIAPGNSYLAGNGIAIDLGASYKIFDNLTVHASITDLGFIHWKKDYLKTTLSEHTVEFKSITASDLDSLFNDIENVIDLDQITEDIEKEINISQNDDGKGRNTWLYTTFNLGGEYTFFEDKLGLGLLYQSKITSLKWFHEITASVNYRPFRNTSLSLSYSILQGYNAIGFAFNYRPTYFLNFFLGLDYIPITYTSQYIPLKTKGYNFQFGITIPLASKKKVKENNDDL